MPSRASRPSRGRVAADQAATVPFRPAPWALGCRRSLRAAGRGRANVPACALDVERVRAGADPDVRKVMVGAQRVPYWQGGRAYEPYAAGYFAAFGPLTWMFMGGMMFGGFGGGFDDDGGGDGGGGDGGGGDGGGDGGRFDGGGESGGFDGGGFDMGF